MDSDAVAKGAKLVTLADPLGAAKNNEVIALSQEDERSVAAVAKPEQHLQRRRKLREGSEDILPAGSVDLMKPFVEKKKQTNSNASRPGNPSQAH